MLRSFSRPDLSAVIIGFYLVPVLAAIVLPTVGAIDRNVVTLLFGTGVVGFFCGLIYQFFTTPGTSWRHLSGRHVVIVGAMTFLIFLSVFLNDVSMALAARGGLQALYIGAVIVLLPFLFSRLSKEEEALCLRRLALFFVASSAMLVMLDVAYHLLGKSYNPRLVHPVSIHLWALVSWFICLNVLRAPRAAFLFAIAVIWSASRLSVCMMTLYYLWMVFESASGSAGIRRLASTMLFLCLAIGCIHFALPQKSPLIPYARYLAMATPIDLTPYVKPSSSPKSGDFSSNRRVIYPNAMEKLSEKDSWWKGYAEEVKIPAMAAISQAGKEADGKEASVHNSFLRGALFYGIPYAILSYVLWFMCFMPDANIRDAAGSRPAWAYFLFWFLTVQSFLFSTFWTNMADPPVFMICLMLMTARLGKGRLVVVEPAAAQGDNACRQRAA